MEILLILVATFFSTTMMTLFSYAVSASFRDLYKEPVLLQYVMDGLDIELNKKYRPFISWIVHYLIGLLFVACYFFLSWIDYYKITWLSGIVFGAVGGVAGIVGWMGMFRISQRKPMLHPSAYYLQLFIAHLIFGITTAGIYFMVN